MKDLKDYIKEEIFTTPSNTIGMENPFIPSEPNVQGGSGDIPMSIGQLYYKRKKKLKKITSNNIKEGLKLTSKLKINSVEYDYHPKTKHELNELIEQLIEERGPEADLNDIDTSEITDMRALFFCSKFDGNISKWDVSSVENMSNMFNNSKFTGNNGDISDWDVSKVKDMQKMFNYSQFNGDISDWDVSSVEDMSYMFQNSKFDGDISKWNISHVEDMQYMFIYSNFTGKHGNLSNWKSKFRKGVKTYYMFHECPLEKNPPKWYKK